MSEFFWTDELVRKFAAQQAIEAVFSSFDHKPTKEISIEDFKREHSNTHTVKEDESNVVDGGSKDWKILEIELPKGNVTIVHNGSDSSVIEWVKNNKCKIRSVKRLSDGEVFSIGDNCKHGDIKRFSIGNWSNEMIADFEYGDVGCSVRLSDLEKQKPILFTTEDGKPIYIGDNAWCVHSDFEIIHYKHIEGDWVEEDEKWFSTEEAANTYVLENRPILSLNDIINLDKTKPILPSSKYYYDRLKELVKSKIK